MLSNTKEPQKGNWRYLLVAFLLAIGLWYTLNAREQIERVVEVRLDYKGLPPGLIVTGGQLNKVSVRLRGPQELLRSMTNREIYDGSVRRDAGQERDPADDGGKQAAGTAGL